MESNQAISIARPSKQRLATQERLLEAIGESEWPYRAVFEHAAIGMAHIGLDDHLLLVNQCYCDIVGYSRDELLRMKFQDLTHLDYVEASLAHQQRLLAGEADTYAMEKRYIRRDGSTIWVRTTVSLIRTPSNEPAHFVAIVEDINERKQLERRTRESLEGLLRESAEAHASELTLREAKRRMDEFLGITSHELRTPLTTIKANVQFAKRRLKKIAVPAATAAEDIRDKLNEAQDLLGKAERQVEVLNRLVGDLVDISRIEADKMELRLRPEPCNLAAIVREVVAVQRRVTASRPIRLKIATRKVVLVIADADRLVQVLTNYLSNAQKYSPIGLPIEVSLRLQTGVAYVSVRDQGPGLPPAEQERIWERFYQAGCVKHHCGFSVGLGLGLYISSIIIEQHHGQVGVESAPGQGSTFWFSLPLFKEPSLNVP